jgi:cytochrome oxidase assembly protein ShyY1
VLRTLREPRYAALSVLMLIVAAICVLAGTWQISRLSGKVTENGDLRHNAHAATAPVGEVLPLVGKGTPATDSIQYRTVTATGTYQSAGQALVRQRTVDGDTGYLVLTPLRTSDGTLLVVRGFISGTAATTGLPAIPTAPTGQVSVTARVQPAETRNDRATQLGGKQLEAINPRLQAVRLGTPVYAGYVELHAGQPGTSGLTAIPAPDLSNPAGGAIEPQHVAYIIQWYLFALLALAAPFAVARAETRGHDDDDREVDDVVTDVPQTPDEARAARLADRYGRVVR